MYHPAGDAAESKKATGFESQIAGTPDTTWGSNAPPHGLL
jgi:hypothetical protein